MPIDYEAEYNNRARVPEYVDIFARWTREAEDYRVEAMQERRAELGLSYGESQRQFIDLFSPRPEVTAPLALFIHGGYWRSLEPVIRYASSPINPPSPFQTERTTSRYLPFHSVQRTGKLPTW